MVRAYKGVKFRSGVRADNPVIYDKDSPKDRQEREEARWAARNGPVTSRQMSDDELRERGIR